MSTLVRDAGGRVADASKRGARALYLAGLDLPGYAFVGRTGSACDRDNGVTTIGALDRSGALEVLRRFPHMRAFRLTPVRPEEIL